MIAELWRFREFQPRTLGYDYGAANNGQIQTVHYYTTPGSEDLTKSESFTYDAWGRLKQAQTLQVSASTPYTFKLQWGYDQLGNRLSQAMLDGNLPGGVGTPTFTIDTGTNRITTSGYGYDSAGNMTAAPGFTYAFDGANRLTGINGVNMYTYFGPLRIKKVNGTATTVYIYSGSKPIVEYVNGSLSREYVYSGSTLLATIAGGAATYHHPDHLSNRVETDSAGASVRTFGQLPYGEVWYEPTGTDKLKFTTYERDSATGETGLDYAMFRHYSPGLGRFMTADLLDGNLTMPQSMNLYSYIANDAINGIDSLGLCPENDPFCFHLDVWRPFLPEGGAGGGFGTYAPLQDGGPGVGGGGGQRGADLFRCAAQVGNALSLAALLPKDSNQFLKNALSNDASTISDLLTGPPPARLDAAASVAQGRLTSTATAAIGAIPVGPPIYKLGENGAGTVFVKDVVKTPLAEKALGKVAGAALGSLLEAKLAWDGATYLYGLLKCW